MSEEKKIVNVKVFRFDPANNKEPHYDTFQVETTLGFSVYNALKYIAENLDPTFSFYASCRIGQCQGCLAKINGKVNRTCTTMLTDDVVVDPVNADNVLRDLTPKSKLSLEQ